ncbi:MAG: hypothetical protein ACI9VT_001093 [Psychroserpens sp.]|jgi:hypothetical protein
MLFQKPASAGFFIAKNYVVLHLAVLNSGFKFLTKNIGSPFFKISNLIS